MITVGKRLYQFGSRHRLDIRKARKANLRELGDVIMGYHLTNHRGIIKNARLLALAKHLIQIALINRQSISLQHGSIEGRRFLFANRRQLRLIADKHQAVVSALIHKMYQVIQQASAAEVHATQSHIGNHRSLIHHKERIGKEIVVEIELTIYPGKRLFAIDASMDGISRRSTVQRKHLSRPARWSQEHHLLPDGLQGADDGTRKRSFTRTRTTPENHHHLRVPIGKEACKYI